MTCIQRLQVKNFRCFSSSVFDLNAPVVLIEGSNGSGKTSLLEALHYACYLKSFRTYIPRDLIAFEKESFFINATCNDHTITIGSTGTKRQVKIDQKAITSYKELQEYYRAVTVTEDDLELVKSSPEKRRLFLDYALVLQNGSLATLYKQFKHALDQRNALLHRIHTFLDNEEFIIWTSNVWHLSIEIQKLRRNYLDNLTKHIATLCNSYWTDKTYTLVYQEKEHITQYSFEEFITQSKQLFERELHLKRTLFGAHLDDIEICLEGKKSRLFSSRGQQKLIVLLMKIAQIKHLLESFDTNKLVFLLDDFMTDFDASTLEKLMKICLDLKIQLIFSSPLQNSPENLFFEKNNILSLKISI